MFVRLREHADVGDDGDVGQMVRLQERGQDGQRSSWGLGPVALEGVHRQWEPGTVSERSDGDLWFKAPLLAEPGFAEPVVTS